MLSPVNIPCFNSLFSRTNIEYGIEEDLEDIRHNTTDGEKYFTHFPLEIRDVRDELVATVRKTIYVRKKRQAS